MKIAFASCMCTRVFSDQPVWEQVAAQKPDRLVLLGDSVYLDIATPVMPCSRTKTSRYFPPAHLLMP